MHLTKRDKTNEAIEVRTSKDYWKNETSVHQTVSNICILFDMNNYYLEKCADIMEYLSDTVPSVLILICMFSY